MKDRHPDGCTCDGCKTKMKSEIKEMHKDMKHMHKMAGSHLANCTCEKCKTAKTEMKKKMKKEMQEMPKTNSKN